MRGVKLGPVVAVGSLLAIVFLPQIFAAHLAPKAQTPGFDAYAAVHGKTPILALPGTDIAQAQIALAELKKSAAVAIFPFSDDESGTLHNNVYPYAYLESLLSLEDARRHMLAKPSEESGATYHEKLFATLTLYAEALQKTRDALAVGMPTRFSSFGGTTGAVYVASILARGIERIELLKAEERRRYACAAGESLRCKESPVWPEKSYPRREKLDLIKYPKTLPPNIAAIRESLRAYTEQLNIPLSDVITISLDASSCYPSYQPAYYDLSTHPSELSGVPAGRFTLINDAFFYDTATIEVNYSQALYRSGAIYSYQPFNMYICQNSGRELGDLLAIRYAKQSLTASPITPVNRFSLAAVRNILKAQEAFLAEEIPTQQAYRALVETIEQLFETVDEQRLTEIFGSRDEWLRVRDLAAVAHTRSAQFELILGYLDDMQTTSYTTGVFDTVRTNVFFMLRAGISPLFLVANETGPFPSDTSLFYEHANQELPPTGYTLRSYTRDLQSSHSLDELLNMHLSARTDLLQPLVDDLIVRRGR